MIKDFRLGLCQFAAKKEKELNIQKAVELVGKAVEMGCQVVVLPECFNTPYSIEYFADYAEDFSESRTISAMQDLSRAHKIYLIAGSIPEKSEGRLYNTSVSLNPSGEIIGKHRKVHLFDVDFPGRITFFESHSFTAGDEATIIETEFCKIGIGICYDIRFPEYAWTVSKDPEVGLIVYPGCFNMTTGPAHWELLIRARAVDNSIYVAGCSQARDVTAAYVAWGHTTISNPFGAHESIDESEGILVKDIESQVLQDCRKSLRNREQKRFDVYQQ